MEMSYCNDAKSARFDLIDHSVWKSIDQTTTGVLSESRPSIRILNDTSNGSVDFLGKLKTKA
jgi:hypothetical protein